MKIIQQRDNYATLLRKTYNKIEEIIFNGFFLLHVVNQQLNRGMISFSISPLISGSMSLIESVVHPTHILVHPRVHRAHRLKSAAVRYSSSST